MRRLFYFLLCIIIAFLLFSCSNQQERTFHIIETYRIASLSDIRSYLSVDLPISYGYQTIGELDVKNAENYFFEDRDGFRTLHVSIEGDGEEKIITIEYDVTLQNGKSNWKDETSDQYLVPEEFIDSDDDNIVDIANTLKVDGDTYQTAKNISHYVSKTIKFDYSTKINVTTPLASEVLENKKGVCQDYANLMTALLRASGIPAKRINGLVLNELKPTSDWSSSGGSHAWVEFYIDGEWYFTDPTWGNRYFTYSDGFHLSYGTQNVNLDSHAVQAKINEIENSKYTLVAAMTAPIKFIAWSEDENTVVTPKVSITKK
jgi:transglutaminase-like putative cysteine protease